MATNKLTEVAGLVAQAVMGAKVKDKDGNAKTVKPIGDDNLLDLTDIVASGSGTGGGDNPNPNAGVDYYAGSLANGEITDRDLLVQVTNDDPTGSNKVTFVQDVGTKVNKVGDGVTIVGYIQKTVVTKGVIGAVSRLDLNYDPNNVVKDEYFTTTSPYPIYINQRDIVVGKKLEVPINGIGENLSGKNVQPAKLFITFNDDNTALIEHEAGYDNDGDSTGATGANYQFIVEAIATFSTQTAVAQLTESVNLFSGSTASDVSLSGISDSYENSMDGIFIHFDSYIYSNPTKTGLRTPAGPFVSGYGIRIPKEYLINGYVYDSSSIASSKLYSNATLNSHLDVTQWSSRYSKWQPSNPSYFYGYRGSVTPTIKIGKLSLTNNLKFSIQKCYDTNGKISWSEEPAWYWLVTKVTPFKN